MSEQLEPYPEQVVADSVNANAADAVAQAANPEEAKSETLQTNVEYNVSAPGTVVGTPDVEVQTQPTAGVVTGSPKDSSVSVSHPVDVSTMPERGSRIVLPRVVVLPNIKLPCPEGVLIDVRQYLPVDADPVSPIPVYVYGEYKADGDGLRIYPVVPGEQDVEVFYRHKGKKSSVVFKIVATQDPKKLWEKNDPPSGSPFVKNLYETGSYSNAEVRFMAASRRGRSHEHAGTFRDDDFGFWSKPEDGIYLVVVADGAGSAKYSREGSRQAVQSVVDYLAPRLTSSVWTPGDENETQDGKVAQLLVAAANNALVQLDAFCKAENVKPGVVEKLALKDFNTTMLMAVMRVLPNGTHKIVSFSIGDGAIAWVEPGSSELLCNPDGGEYSGQTRFLTTTPVWVKASKDWAAFRKERVFTKMIGADSFSKGFLALMTDGVSDPFFETDVKLHECTRWDDLVLNEADVDDGPRCLRDVIREPECKVAAEKMMLWLGFWSRGNHDDRTLAVLTAVKASGVYFD